MNDTRLLELEQRVRRLKEEVRRLRARRASRVQLGLAGLAVLGGLALAAIGAAGLPPAAAQPGKPAARPLTVFEAPVDIQGKDKKTIVRIQDDPVPALWLVGAKGAVKLEIAGKGGTVDIRADKAHSC